VEIWKCENEELLILGWRNFEISAALDFPVNPAIPKSAIKIRHHHIRHQTFSVSLTGSWCNETEHLSTISPFNLLQFSRSRNWHIFQ
jgi:hypothetical protein